MTPPNPQAAQPAPFVGLKAAIFDLDGVVLSTQLIHAKAWALTFNEAIRYLATEGAALSEAGTLRFSPTFDAAASYRPFTHQDYLDHVDGKDRTVGADGFLKARGIELRWGAEADHWREASAAHFTVAGLCQRKNELVNRMFDQPGADDEKVQAFGSTIARIRELRARGLKIAAASSSKNAEKVLKLAGVFDLFDAVVCGLDITDPKTQSKPSPFLFLEAARRVGVQAHESMVVEDAQAGVQAGRDGGFKLVVGLSRDPANHAKLAEFADVVVPDLEEIGVERLEQLTMAKAPQPAARTRVRPWELHFSSFDPAAEKVTEVLTALGNGYLGQRSSLSGLGLGAGVPAFYVAGLFNARPEDTADLVNLPAWAALRIFDGLDALDLRQGRVLSFSRNLDFRCGVLTIDLVWESPHHRTTRLIARQFLSHADPHVAAVRFEVTPLNYRGRVQARSVLDEDVTNRGERHLTVLDGGCDAGSRIQHLTLQTTGKKVVVREALRLDLDGPPDASLETVREPGSKFAALEAKAVLAEGEALTLDKLAYLSTSRPGDRLEDAAAAVAKLPGFDDLLSATGAVWAGHWGRSDVQLEGEAEDQQAIRFVVYHLCSLGHGSKGTTSIAAKGLSNLPGTGYRGHVFWDTELFMLQFFGHTAPEVARNLLRYRYHTLPQAKAKARRLGYQGALYAWESTDTGAEETPHSAGGCRVWCGETEHHISADIAYAVDQYVRLTGDVEFLKREGAELLLETARFWASRAEPDPKTGGYSIFRVIGPDEFHEGPGREEGGVDGSVYTNVMARWNIRKAIEVLDGLPEADRAAILSRAGFADDYAAWKLQAAAVAGLLKVNFDPATKLFEQFDGYFGLADPLDPQYRAQWIREDGRFVSHAMDSYLKDTAGRADRAAWTQIVKQADIVMMLYLLEGAFEPEVVKKNFQYYAPRTSHGSSLSSAIHAIMALRTGDPAAGRYFKDAFSTDLGDEMGNASGGIHAAALGGAWQAVVNGYGGLSLRADRLCLAPELRPNWKRLAFRVTYRGTPLEVRVTRQAVEIEPLSELPAPILLEVWGQELLLHQAGTVRVASPAAGPLSIRQTA